MDRSMKDQTSQGLRILLLVYAILWAIYGLVHIIAPQLVQAIDPPIERVLGAAVVVFALGAGLAYSERAWSRVRLLVLLQLIWMILYTILMAWGIFAGGITPAAWPPTIIAAVFAVLLVTFYLRDERQRT